ncbi:MAG: aspartate--tRNA ligase [Lentisphaerae bacterium RIFOXYC12_FULL_60_16]|nr:MAG: aspartate--tRNA ligase [Lentisphaerae bacterium RIFOXYC12_FULL_60_16]
MHGYRTHTCGELRGEQAGQEVRLSGWVFRKRDHGSLLFIDLRDHYGLTQVVVQPDRSFFEHAQSIRLESVITVTGRLAARSPETVNPDMPTGTVELVAESLEVDSMADPLPFHLSDEDAPEDLRLRYRFLDLRRQELHDRIVLRSDVIHHIRQTMREQGFKEYQTPILTSSSPEGARDYLVPSRVHPGKFYALPQSPQQFKQLLMLSGFDRYFQIAACFRDEDARADRSPGEHYQLDVEMSFVEQDDIFKVVETVLHGVFSKFATWKVDAAPFRRIPYREAMLKYGSDKPDLRIPIEMVDVTDIFRNSGFNAFRAAIEQKAVVRAIPVKAIADRPRSFFDKLVEYAQSIGAKGLAYLVWEGGVVKGPIAKFLKPAELEALRTTCGMGEGDVVFFMCDKEGAVNRITGDLRLKLGRDLDRVEPGIYRFCWIVDFPMYEFDEENKQVMFSHNPFSMPQGGLKALSEQDPLTILAYQYDVVCNGIELGSGAIRNHRPDIMMKAFAIAGYEPDAVERNFPALLNAFRYGAPPHAGIAPGIDRMVMMLCDQSNIREVIAFPMNQRAQDLMMNAPNEVSIKQLRELHIRLNLPPTKEAPKTPPAEPSGKG